MKEQVSREECEAILARSEKATAGPWDFVNVYDGAIPHGWAVLATNPMRGRIDSKLTGMTKDDAHFISEARSDVERLARAHIALLDECESLRQTLTESILAMTEFEARALGHYRHREPLSVALDMRVMIDKILDALRDKPVPETGAGSNAERELSDQLAAALDDCVTAFKNRENDAICEAALCGAEAVLAQHAAARAKESNSTAEQSRLKSNTTP